MARPLLFLDVDGVLNPFPDTPPGYAEYRFFPEDDEPVRLCAEHGGWLRELAGTFEIVWASAWGASANALICATFELPEFPFVTLPPVPFDPCAKVPAVATYARDRPAAWLDDIVTDEARAWAAGRPAPTLIMEVRAVSGLSRDLVDRVLTWAGSLA